MEASFSDKLAGSLAIEVGFDCYKLQSDGIYAFRKKGIGSGPPLHGWAAGPNPCGEIPLDWYELCIEIRDTTLIINGVLKFDLNDPNSIDKIKAEFNDTATLTKKISRLRQGHPEHGYTSTYGKRLK